MLQKSYLEQTTETDEYGLFPLSIKLFVLANLLELWVGLHMEKTPGDANKGLTWPQNDCELRKLEPKQASNVGFC
jgi:hypothetical protein